MGCESNGTQRRVPAEERLNVFALVIYLPDPLSRFLDDLRCELVPHDKPHAHVSVLPPRPLAVDSSIASDQVRSLTDAWSPFEIELTSIEMFPVTNVIYLELGAGAAELRELHKAMNAGPLAFDEPFVYHPHVTLAQELRSSDVAAAHATARRRWESYRGKRSFRAERAVFVQNTLHNIWVDLAEFGLGTVAVR
ncbi:MAG TPA: 2'-5' RNA ligase family protein [Bryobacteraceae bacterium]|nr:2'-5' RNA ligase family protein [Bryobacteraceae bacterium]